MPISRLLHWVGISLTTLLFHTSALALELDGEPVQGGLIFGTASPGSQVFLDETKIMVSEDGRFVFGFGRDETGQRKLQVTEPDGKAESLNLTIAVREYKIEQVDGLPPRTVTPDPEAAERIREEQKMVVNARARRSVNPNYEDGFSWPASGRISGVYGSQRVLNGEPRRPHFGLDIAAPTGSPVYAPADGVITMTHPDMYFSGGTIILDHGQGLSSTFLHLSKILTEAGSVVKKGDLIAEIGATGRASGPHLDWRMNWMNQRVDPQLLMHSPPPAAADQ